MKTKTQFWVGLAIIVAIQAVLIALTFALSHGYKDGPDRMLDAFLLVSILSGWAGHIGLCLFGSTELFWFLMPLSCVANGFAIMWPVYWIRNRKKRGAEVQHQPGRYC